MKRRSFLYTASALPAFPLGLAPLLAGPNASRRHARHQNHRHQDLPRRRRQPQSGLRQSRNRSRHSRHRRGLFLRPRRGHRRHDQRLQALARRPGPAQHRAPLGHDDELHALPRRPRRQRGHQRHRARPVGHLGQGRRPARLSAARRQVPRQDSRLSKRRRRRAQAPSPITPPPSSGNTATRP